MRDHQIVAVIAAILRVGRPGIRDQQAVDAARDLIKVSLEAEIRADSDDAARAKHVSGVA